MTEQPLSKEARVWRLRILIATWLSYAGFYFCRKNFMIVKSAVLERLELSTVDVAHVFTAFLVAYMVGQFATGYLGRKVHTRQLLLWGMATTMVCNLAFGLSYLMGPAGYWVMLLFMIINGLAQATGWPGNIGVLSNWLRRQERGRAMAIWATSYQIGSILAKTFAAFMLGLAGALWSFWGAAAIMAVVWAVFFVLERDQPEDVGLPTIVEAGQPKPASGGGLFEGWDRGVVFTIFLMGSCYFALKFLRYSLDSWSPLVTEQLFQLSKVDAGYVSTFFDWIGFVGVLFAGWVSDHLFHGRRYQTILLMTFGTVAAFVFLAMIGVQSVTLFGVGLSLCGFMLMGPDSLLSGVGAADVGGRRGAVTAAGIINGLGSIGPILQEELIGWLLVSHGHAVVFYLLVGVSVVGVMGTSYLSSRSRRGLSTL